MAALVPPINPLENAVVEALVTVRRLSVLLNANPATPPESVAGVAFVEVQNGTRPEVSADDVAILSDAAPEPVMVNGEAPMTVNAVQDTVPAQDTVVVEVVAMRIESPP